MAGVWPIYTRNANNFAIDANVIGGGDPLLVTSKINFYDFGCEDGIHVRCRLWAGATAKASDVRSCEDSYNSILYLVHSF